eukprot:3862280-Ditylum_brightwellii.AAC.1
MSSITESVPAKCAVQSSLSAEEEEEPDEAATVAAAAACIIAWDDDKSIQSAAEVVSSMIVRDRMLKTDTAPDTPIRDADVLFWARCSIFAASILVKDAATSKNNSVIKLAQVASAAVLKHCIINGKISQPSHEHLCTVAKATSVALLKSGGIKKAEVASATTVAILNEGNAMLQYWNALKKKQKIVVSKTTAKVVQDKKEIAEQISQYTT